MQFADNPVETRPDTTGSTYDVTGRTTSLHYFREKSIEQKIIS